MSIDAAVLPQEDPYQGLRDLSARTWKIIVENTYAMPTWQKFLPVRGGAPGVLDDIANFLSGLMSHLTYLKDSALGWFQGAINWALGHFTSLKDSLSSHLTWLKDSTLGWFQGAINWVLGHLTSLKDSLSGHLTWLKDSFLGWWQGALNWVLGHLTWLKDTLSSHLTWLKDSFLGWWQGAINWALGHLTSLKDSLLGHLTWLKDSFLGWWQGALNWILGHLERLSALWERFQEDWPGQLLGIIGSGFFPQFSMIIDALRDIRAFHSPTMIEEVERAIADMSPHVQRWVGNFAEIPATYFNFIAASAGTDLALHPATAMATTGSVYGMSIAAGSVAMTLATALNAIPATNWVGAQQFAAFIAEVAGFEPITRASYGVLLNEVLAWPLRYHWNMQLRPRIPTEGALLLMGRKRGLSEAEWRQAMAYQGIPDWYLDKIYLFNWTDPSPFWVSRVTEAHIPDWHPGPTWQEWADQWIPGWRADPFKWVRAKLMLAGYEDADVDSMIQGIQGKLMASPTTQVKTSVRAMLREGYWGRAEAEGALRPMGVRQEEIEYLLLAEELDYQKRYLDDQIRYFQEAFRKGQLDEQDLSLALSTIIVKPERVAQEVARERIRALPTPKSITAPKEDPLVKSLRTQAINSWTKAYRNWEISAEDLLLGFTIVVQDATLAAEMVAVEKTRYREPPEIPAVPEEDPIIAKSRRQAIASWITAFRDGEIDGDQLELYLEPLIPNRDARVQIVQLEKLRYKPTPELIPPVSEDEELAKVRQEYVRGHIEMFQKRLIEPEQLYTYLLADGLVEELARATVITQATKRIKTPPLDSPYFQRDIWQSLVDEGIVALSDQFMEEKITIQEYLAYLAGMGLDPDLATYLADTLTLRRFLESL